MTSSGYYLLTGATGLLGRYLLRDMLAAGLPVAVLVRSAVNVPARARIEGILARFEADTGYALPRPVVLEGDLPQPRAFQSKAMPMTSHGAPTSPEPARSLTSAARPTSASSITRRPPMSADI